MSEKVVGINYHLQKVFADRELEEEAVIRSFRITAADGKLVFIDAGHDNEAGNYQTCKDLGDE